MGFFRRLFARHVTPGPPGERKPLYPECLYIVTVTDEDVTVTNPQGQSRRLAWDEIEAVSILTNSLGPLVADVFFILTSPSFHLSIPQGATGDDKLLERLQKLPGFNNQALIDAMCSTDDHLFHCWSRPVFS